MRSVVCQWGTNQSTRLRLKSRSWLALWSAGLIERRSQRTHDIKVRDWEGRNHFQILLGYPVSKLQVDNAKGSVYWNSLPYELLWMIWLWGCKLFALKVFVLATRAISLSTCLPGPARMKSSTRCSWPWIPAWRTGQCCPFLQGVKNELYSCQSHKNLQHKSY